MVLDMSERNTGDVPTAPGWNIPLQFHHLEGQQWQQRQQPQQRHRNMQWQQLQQGEASDKRRGEWQEGDRGRSAKRSEATRRSRAPSSRTGPNRSRKGADKGQPSHSRHRQGESEREIGCEKCMMLPPGEQEFAIWGR
eukprot:GHVU01064498.1.p2 GENE.GHVU01064498.1~~GHVU01064498.1.p2  ORF type:complete len:138 (+),score=21.90 GHVU01064498.1:1210-1623(+)